MTTFRPGQKVVCVSDFQLTEDAELQIEAGVVLPKCGHIYTVREVRSVITYTGSVTGLRLREIRNPEIAYLGGADPAEIAFAAVGFRPIVSGQTDISVFKDMLAPADAKEVA